jgi:hypothetical protein
MFLKISDFIIELKVVLDSEKEGSFISFCTLAPVYQLHSTIPEAQEELLIHQGKAPIQ